MLVRILVAGLLPLFATMAAQAQSTCSCGGTQVVGSALQTLLSNRTVCAASGNESWQEFHHPAGPLVDWKKGPSDPVDPSETVGSWSLGGNKVNYNYGSGGTYQYDVCVAGSTVNFCGGSRNITGATLRQGQVSCSASAPLPLAVTGGQTATR